MILTDSAQEPIYVTSVDDAAVKMMLPLNDGSAVQFLNGVLYYESHIYFFRLEVESISIRSLSGKHWLNFWISEDQEFKEFLETHNQLIVGEHPEYTALIIDRDDKYHCLGFNEVSDIGRFTDNIDTIILTDGKHMVSGDRVGNHIQVNNEFVTCGDYQEIKYMFNLLLSKRLM